MSRRERSVERLAARLGGIAGATVELERPKNAEHGDFATNVALRTAANAGRPPRELAGELAARFVEDAEVADASVAGRAS